MEFNQKLQELRKSKGLTQQELAESLYVSRTAISKWESGRGYPNIDSLKEIAKFFSVKVDDLLSCDEVLSIAEEDTKQKKSHFCDLVFGALDCSAALLFFLPFFGQEAGDAVYSVSLVSLTDAAPFLKAVYFAAVIGIALWGVLIFALQNCRRGFWEKGKRKGSLILNVIGVVLFMVSRQVYASVFLFLLLIIKVLLIVKKQ